MVSAVLLLIADSVAAANPTVANPNGAEQCLRECQDRPLTSVEANTERRSELSAKRADRTQMAHSVATSSRVAALEPTADATPTGPSTSADGPLGPPNPALAQIIVTAQKYTQPAFNVPISLAVISGSTLLQMGANNLEQLQIRRPRFNGAVQ